MDMNPEVGDAAEGSIQRRNNSDADNESSGSYSCDKDSGSENGDEHAGIDRQKAHRLLADLICSCEVAPLAMLDFSNQLKIMILSKPIA